MDADFLFPYIGMWISFMLGSQLEKNSSNTALLLIFCVFSMGYSVYVSRKLHKNDKGE